MAADKEVFPSSESWTQETPASPLNESRFAILLQIGDERMARTMGVVKAKGSQQHTQSSDVPFNGPVGLGGVQGAKC